MMGRMRLRIIFSKIFENSGRRLIGLYDLGESGGFSGLRITMITENFHRTGKYKSLNMELYIYVSISMAFFWQFYSYFRCD
jgi:hypothetical protein